MRWYVECLKKYADFSGRARRKEYWMFFLFNVLIVTALGILETVGSGPSTTPHVNALTSLYRLAVLLPSLAVGVRRMHDSDYSGWWLIVPFVGLFLALQEGESGDNRFGPDPQATTVEIADSQVAVSA